MKNRRTVVLVSLILAALILLGVSFVTGIKQLLLSETQGYLIEVSKQGAKTISGRLEGKLDALEELASLDSFDISVQDSDKVTDTLMRETERKGFIRMGIADLEGNAYTSDHQSFSVSDRDYFSIAKQGRPCMSSRLVDKLGERPGMVVFAAPIYRETQVVGVLFATDYTEKIVRVIQNMTFVSGGDIFVISGEGEVLAKGARATLEDEDNFFDEIGWEMRRENVERLHQNMREGKSGTEEYVYQGITQLLGYTPIQGTEDWYLMVSAPKSVVMDQANQIIWRTTLLIGSFILLSAFGFWYLLRLRGRYNQERNISRAALSSSEMHLLRVGKDGSLLSFDEGFSQRLGFSPKELTGIRLGQLGPANQKNIIESLKSQESFEYKLRVKNRNQPLYMRFYRIETDHPQDFYEMMCLDITERQLRNLEIQRLAYTDQLTGLPNRMFMIDAIRQRLGSCRVDKAVRAMVMVDVDHFQMFNNTFGYKIGDAALTELSGRLQHGIGPQDTVGRVGGDEFILLLESVGSKEGLSDILSRLINSLDEPYQVGDNVFLMPCSIGAVIYDETGEGTLEAAEYLLYCCETASHKAVEQARSSFIIFDTDLKKQLQEKVQLEQALKAAINRRELELYYQAQYDRKEQRITGYESLLRWNSPQYGMVSPARFIPVAEQCGFIVELGRFVIEETFAFAKRLEGTRCCVSFNTSAVELMQSGYTDYVCESCRRYQLEPGSIALEITESCLIESFPEAVENLRRLREQGIRIYLDDFGTGYSALNYLKNLPLDSVKVDKSFVDGIVENSVEQDIVRTIATLSRRLGLKVIAEGVETKQQMDCLYQCGCRYIQGYYISRPVPEDQALLLLEEYRGEEGLV